MFQIRPFVNSDPPHLAAIWRSQPPQRGLAQPMNASILELCVFSKQFFDPEGLLVAERQGDPIGFAHAAFGPSEVEGEEASQNLDTTIGSTQLLLLRPDAADDSVADALIAASEAYQRERGATVHYAGGIRPLNGFYMGLYGGSELPGILDSDPTQAEHFRRNDYVASSRVVVLQRELPRMRSPGVRETRLVRRENEFEQTMLPRPRSWWEACITGGHDRIRFALRSRASGEEIASAVFWDIEPLASAWGIPTVGITELEVEPGRRRQKVATYLLGEALRHVLRRGAARAEAQTMENNEAALALYESLGFTRVDGGAVFRREARE